MASRSLVLWMNGVRVGRWIQDSRRVDILEYDEDWLTHPAGRALSLSLPFVPGNVPHRGAPVANYFDNLLPENDAIRRRLRSRFGTENTEAFALLAAIGRDCVGAVQLLPEDAAPSGTRKIDAEPLDSRGVEAALRASLGSGGVLGQQDSAEFRISIAGAQEKTAFVRHKGRWCLPRGTTPTTHIFKLPLGLVGNLQADMRDSVENEWLCMELLRAFGLPVAETKMEQFGAQRVLVVERFDRAHQPGGWIARLPQEDFCQALGVPSTLKYESDGGPGLRDLMRILAGSSRAKEDRETLLKAQILFWVLGATDGHAKNFSLFNERGGTYRLTPLYDVLSAWPIVGPGANQLDERKMKLAMALRGKNPHWKYLEIRPRHWDAVAKQAGLGDAQALLHDVLTEAPKALTKVDRKIPTAFPLAVRDKIFAGVERSLRRLSEG